MIPFPASGKTSQTSRLVAIFILIASPLALAEGHSHHAPFFVAPTGNDAWSGTLPAPNATRTDGPFATLERARDAIRELKKAGPLPAGGLTVFLRGGVYELRRLFELTADDSGRADAPVEYRAYKGETVRLLGGKLVTGFKPVTQPLVLKRLQRKARGRVLWVNLRALGITDFGEIGAGPGLELFFQEKPMTLARWPNAGFVNIVDVLGSTPVDDRGTIGAKEGTFTYEGERPRRWTKDKDAWVHGYWFWDWLDQHQKIESIDTDRHVISLAPPFHVYGYRKGQWFYFFNILAELDTPGEWYLDRETGILYFWPPAPIAKGTAMVSVLPALVTMRDTSYVTLRGLTFEAARGTAITIIGGRRNRIVGCTLRNLGGWAVHISGGMAHGVVGCDISQTGEGGITLEGGDRTSLTPASHYADNNHIHDYSRWNRMYKPAIWLSGVGNRATHNLIHDAPHIAIVFSGNDHLIELNEIHSVCYESNDAGAIYAGRDWTMRGTVIRYNYLHDVSGFQGAGAVGVYLDDMLCGTTISSNVFHHVTRAAFIGGGRDNSVMNNIFVDCTPAVHVDARALGWAYSMAEPWIKEGREAGTLSGTRFDQPPYSEHYPALMNILNDQPTAPKDNVIAGNISSGGQWDEIDGEARPLITFGNNLLDDLPHFADAASNFQLRNDSLDLKLGFKPMETIGLVNDGTRASWPVTHRIRPMATPPVAPQAATSDASPPRSAPLLRAPCSQLP